MITLCIPSNPKLQKLQCNQWNGIAELLKVQSSPLKYYWSYYITFIQICSFKFQSLIHLKLAKDSETQLNGLNICVVSNFVFKGVNCLSLFKCGNKMGQISSIFLAKTKNIQFNRIQTQNTVYNENNSYST